MAGRRIPLLGDGQPQEVVEVDRSTPFGAGCVSVVIGGRTYDVGKDSNVWTPSSTLVPAVSQSGTAWNCTTTAAALTGAGDISGYVPTSKSIAILGVVRNSGAASTRYFFADGGAGGSGQSIALALISGNKWRALALSNNDSTLTSSTGDHAFLFCWDGNFIKLWVDGQVFIDVNLGAGRSAGSGVTTWGRYGSYSSAGIGLDSTFNLGAISQMSMPSDDYAKWLTANPTTSPWQIFAPQFIQVPPLAAGGAPTEALTGYAATGSAGILVPALSLATTGNSATASQGTATPALSLATTGNAATASAGTPVASITLALTGNGATSSVGTVAIGGTTQALTGNAATTSAGTPVAQITLALTGNGATANVGTVAPALSKALTGNAVTASRGTPVAALSLALTGSGATASAGTVAVPGIIVPSSNVATTSSGTVSPGITIALTGNGATASVGTVSKAISLALSGLAGTSSAGIVVPGLSKALTGNAATAAVGSVAVATGDITLALSGNLATASVGSLAIGGMVGQSEWWRYDVPANNLRYTVPAHNLRYDVDTENLT